MRTIAVSLMLLSVSLAACGRPGAPGMIDHPTGEGELVLRVQHAGGLFPPWEELRQVPFFSLYGDGRVVMEGPQIEIFPPPALPPLLQTRLSEEGVQQVLAEARQAGLFQPLGDYGQPPVADAPFTIFTVTAAGEARQLSVYALGIEEQQRDLITEEQAAARRRLMDFQSRLFDLESWLGSDLIEPVESYDPAAVALLVRAADEAALDEELSMEENWPGELPPLPAAPEEEITRPPCLAVSGRETEVVMALAAEVHALTYFHTPDGSLTHVSFRPLLPDEPDCDELGPAEIPPQP